MTRYWNFPVTAPDPDHCIHGKLLPGREGYDPQVDGCSECELLEQGDIECDERMGN